MSSVRKISVDLFFSDHKKADNNINSFKVNNNNFRKWGARLMKINSKQKKLMPTKNAKAHIGTNREKERKRRIDIFG